MLGPWGWKSLIPITRSVFGVRLSFLRLGWVKGKIYFNWGRGWWPRALPVPWAARWQHCLKMQEEGRASGGKLLVGAFPIAPLPQAGLGLCDELGKG